MSLSRLRNTLAWVRYTNFSFLSLISVIAGARACLALHKQEASIAAAQQACYAPGPRLPSCPAACLHITLLMKVAACARTSSTVPRAQLHLQVIEFRWAQLIHDRFTARDLQFLGAEYMPCGHLLSESALVFVENHDRQSNCHVPDPEAPCISLTVKDGDIYKVWGLSACQE